MAEPHTVDEFLEQLSDLAAYWEGLANRICDHVPMLKGCEAPLDRVTSALDQLETYLTERKKRAGGRRMSAIEDMVRHFHEHFGLPIGDTSRTTNRLRRVLIEQEAIELSRAIEDYDADPSEENLCAVAHEAADVLFAVVGTNLTLGIDTDVAARQVLASLLTREGADATGKVRKGSNYVPPDMRPALLAERYGAALSMRRDGDLVTTETQRNGPVESCATCWPRPCAGPPYRSECRRREGEAEP